MTLNDPITGEKLDLYTQRANEDTCYLADELRVVRCLSIGLQLTEDEIIRQLQNSNIDNPICFHDEIFWVE